MNDPAKPSAELRDYLGSLKLETIQAMARSIASSNSEPELGATLREAGEAMPIINEIQGLINERKDAEDMRGHDIAQGQLIFLMALFRVAEDEGYVW